MRNLSSIKSMKRQINFPFLLAIYLKLQVLLHPHRLRWAILSTKLLVWSLQLQSKLVMRVNLQERLIQFLAVWLRLQTRIVILVKGSQKFITTLGLRFMIVLDRCAVPMIFQLTSHHSGVRQIKIHNNIQLLLAREQIS